MPAPTKPAPPPAVAKLLEALYDGLGALGLTVTASADPGGGLDSSGNPIRDNPPKGAPRITSAPEALARALEFNIRWEGGDSSFFALADVLKARKQASAWCGPNLNLDEINDELAGFYPGQKPEVRIREAKRRYAWLHEANEDLLQYLAATGWMGESRMCPEPGITLSPIMEGANPWRGKGLQEYIDSALAIEASGGKPSGM